MLEQDEIGSGDESARRTDNNQMWGARTLSRMKWNAGSLRAAKPSRSGDRRAICAENEHVGAIAEDVLPIPVVDDVGLLFVVVGSPPAALGALDRGRGVVPVLLALQ
jgi:hypothetical protein